jgi:DNA (cytosine-5)-methyltransferase 1
LVLSIERERNAHQTLELRAFFRQFGYGRAPEEYYSYLQGKIPRSELFEKFPAESASAAQIAWHAELGHKDFPPELVDQRIREALGKAKRWVLIGGPPCQAYSMVGRSRLRGGDPEGYENDPRHFLYKEYLRILAVHRPPFFIFENVKGILSSRINGHNAFARILADLKAPKVSTHKSVRSKQGSDPLRYRIFPLGHGANAFFSSKEVSHYVIESEKHGVPQTRHRVILLGVRGDIDCFPEPLDECKSLITLSEVVGDLPRIRSGLSRETDSGECWVEAVRSLANRGWFKDSSLDTDLRRLIASSYRSLDSSLGMGGHFLKNFRKPALYSEWYCDERLGGVCNHTARLHMRDDLHRYLFASCFAKIHKRPPLLKDFPAELLPKHRNVDEAIKTGTRMFSDRFRVQLADSPSTTITSHMAKDGHYFIHPDPLQCRSLTVREAARLQTFPDNYFFEGVQTSQYEQVGNAVPPLLALSIADVVFDLIERSESLADKGKERQDKFLGVRAYQPSLW